MKVCSKCKIEKPKTEFGKRAKNKSGLRANCKSCEAETVKAWREANKERKATTDKAYREANKERKAETGKAWYEANKERKAETGKAWSEANKERKAAQVKAWSEANKDRKAAQVKAWYEANKERKAETDKAWREANKDRIAATVKSWQEANPEKVSAIWRNRRARKRNADGRHSAADVRTIFDNQRGLCANCQTKLFKSGSKKHHIDHIMPLARGGSNWPSNLQCLCPTCNMRKNAKDPIEWAAQNGRLI